MTSAREQTVEQQTDIVRLLLRHVEVPLVGDTYLRGVLPAPGLSESVRIAVGPGNASFPGELTAYEFPLHAGDDYFTAYDLVGFLRTLLTGTHIYPSARLSKVMGMTVVQVDPTAVEAAPSTPGDNALTILRTLSELDTEERPDPRLRGFLHLGPDHLRLYLSTEDTHDVIAADTRPSGAVTALLAALPSLITETDRWTADTTDPHCAHMVDLTTW